MTSLLQSLGGHRGMRSVARPNVWSSFQYQRIAPSFVWEIGKVSKKQFPSSYGQCKEKIHQRPYSSPCCQKHSRNSNKVMLHAPTIAHLWNISLGLSMAVATGHLKTYHACVFWKTTEQQLAVADLWQWGHVIADCSQLQVQ